MTSGWKCVNKPILLFNNDNVVIQRYQNVFITCIYMTICESLITYFQLVNNRWHMHTIELHVLVYTCRSFIFAGFDLYIHHWHEARHIWVRDYCKYKSNVWDF